MKKLCNVVMLPTEKASQVVLVGTINPILDFYGGYRRVKPTREFHQQHLYIITNDDEIKDGDWYFNLVSNDIVKVDFNIDYEQDHCKKIISSTDYTIGLPLIPEGFVKKYVELQGKIDKVMVEFEEISVHPGYVEGKGFPKYYSEFEPKLRQNNTIIISKVMENFTERNVQVIAQDFALFIQKETIAGRLSEGIATGWHDWFKKYNFDKLDKIAKGDK
jgi:hypothetical protein